MAKQIFKEAFNPKKHKDITNCLLAMKNEEELEFSSEIGLFSACADAQQNNEKIFIITHKSKSKPIISNFEFIKD
jgi:hypothetical protein